MSDSASISRRRWILFTWLGWLLGIPCIALLALLGEALGLGGAQGWVGAGMGVGVGFVQGRALRRHVSARQWLLATTAGLTVPFLIVDLVQLMGRDLPYYLLLCVAAGGLCTGLAQAVLLPNANGRRARWLVASALGWFLAATAAWSADALFQTHRVAGVIGALEYLGLVAVGGVLLGVATAPIISQVPAREPVRP